MHFQEQGRLHSGMVWLQLEPTHRMSGEVCLRSWPRHVAGQLDSKQEPLATHPEFPWSNVEGLKEGGCRMLAWAVQCVGSES